MIREALQGSARAIWRTEAQVGQATTYPVTGVALVATAALAPAYVVRWHVGPLPTTLLENAILLTVAIFLVESWRSGTVPVWRSPLTLPAALFLVAGAIAVVAAPSRVAALGIYRAYLVEPVALALVLASVVRTPRQAWLVVMGLWAGASVLAVANAAVVLDAIRHHQLDVRSPAPTALGYLNPNSVALYLVPLLAVAGSAVLHASNRPLRWIAAVFVVIALPASLLTFSRGGWLTMAAVLVGLALTHRRRWWLMAGLACVAVGSAFVPYVSHRAVELLRQGAGNTSGDRVRLWTLTLHLLSRRPIFGTGLAGFKPTVTPLWQGDSTWIVYPHNIALDLWAETGLPGLLSFAWAFGAAAFVSWRGWWRSAVAWRPLHLGVLLALLAVVVHGAIDNPYFKNDLSLEFWILVTLTWCGWRATTRPDAFE